MDPTRFDAAGRTLSDATSRRSISRVLAGLVTGALVAPALESAAKHRHGRNNKKKAKKKEKSLRERCLAQLKEPSGKLGCCEPVNEPCCGGLCCPPGNSCCGKLCRDACDSVDNTTCCPPARACKGAQGRWRCCPEGEICHPGTGNQQPACCPSGDHPCLGPDGRFLGCGHADANCCLRQSTGELWCCPEGSTCQQTGIPCCSNC